MYNKRKEINMQAIVGIALLLLFAGFKLAYLFDRGEACSW